MIADFDFCTSSYLAFRYVASDCIAWKPGVAPVFPALDQHKLFRVKSSLDILDKLGSVIQTTQTRTPVGILLSSGIDSAIVAALLPKDAHAYTVKFDAQWEIDESVGAFRTATALGLAHTVVEVGWQDYLQNMDYLMGVKNAPLHPIEVGLLMAAQAARADGVDTLFVGNGADSTFGGMDKLLAKNWTFDEFVARYTFVEPCLVLTRPRSMREIFEPYRDGEGIDVQGFLKTVHGLGIIQTFETAIHAAGCKMVAPFEQLVLDAPLSIERIRAGETKYLLREVFNVLYPKGPPPPGNKMAFARPMEQWMRDWQGPSRDEFHRDLDMTSMTGDQKWLLFCLERFLGILDQMGGG